MKGKRTWGMLLLVLIPVSFLLAGGIYYITSVKNALWTKAVTDILEVTVQGRHALDTYIEKEMEVLHLLSADLSEDSSDNQSALQNKIQWFFQSNDSFFCADLNSGTLYTEKGKEEQKLSKAQIQKIQLLKQQGIRRPFLDNYTGVWMVGNYEQFVFADGVPGFVQKAQPLAEIAERFSLSFYDNTGFSYVVNRDGDILIRSQHPNSNRTFQNLFDIIDLQGNDEEVVLSFREALQKGQRGVARFQYQKEEYVFCYVPMETASDWYVVSIVPNRVIMEQADKIVKHSQVLLLLIFVSIVVTAAFFLFYRYTTKRVLLAKEEARRAAESANLSKSRFLSNMSHDIRTPMNAIIGMTKLATDHINEPKKVKEYLKNIGLSGQLLVGLINDILDMSKIESGKMTLNRVNVSLEQLLTDLVRIISPTVEQKNQRFDIRLHDIEHEFLCFDALRLNQVMINLLSNAVKFTPEGGAIHVDVTETKSNREGYAHFVFRVADTGIGMKPEFMKTIFSSFTREQDSRVDKIEGTGLGMAITKMIVDMMDGTIQVESKQNQGTVFTVDLEFEWTLDPSLEKLNLPFLRVLVADDDSATCHSIGKLLHELGVKADVTESGIKAVEMAIKAQEQEEEYDLILLDWRMPDLDGVEVVREVRKQLTKNTPVIIFSAYDWAQIESDALNAGVTGFIQKPCFKSTLYHCIRQYVLKEELLPENKGEKEDLTGRRILLAEDNMLNQEIAKEILEGVGAQVETVENGQACIERFKHSALGYFDIILMDVHMPILDGYEATRKIRSMQRPDAANIPIFAMTADAYAEDVEAALQAGMNSHLAKPLDITAMLREIQKYLTQSKSV